MSPRETVLRARGVRVKAPGGTVVPATDLDAAAGEVTLVVAPKGSGRTSLLLALAGRMSGTEGDLRIGEVSLAHDRRHYRQLASVARAGVFVDLEPQLLVREAVVERTLTDNLKTVAGEWRFAQLALEVRDDPLISMPGDALVDSLDEASTTVLTAILAMLRPARLVVLDDVDARLTVDQWRSVHAALTRLARHENCAIVCTSSTPAPQET
ncbi:ATP-binding cassette domain-containing protein [Aestuariimicrobium kwangyangense]|uniref:ATP-binding cassette domain-containing protein n=1 Tax=Aestuariimicrobium kwangyangense TaxID=396389 RepID=UPI0003B630C2|nr:ATP-binding cassette domain-containing protein [Aestuariimicrobium kwangyangense]